MTITKYTRAAKLIRFWYRNYLLMGYGRSLSRKLCVMSIQDARNGKYPPIRY